MNWSEFGMKKDGVIFKDFGRITTETENRDERLKAYVCAILDVSEIHFDDIIKGIKTEKEKEAFIEMICNDIEGRIARFLKVGECI
jgi:hypothetical protein